MGTWLKRKYPAFLELTTDIPWKDIAGHLRAAKTFNEIRDRILKARYEGVSKINEESYIKETTVTTAEKRKPAQPEPEMVM